MTDKGGRVVKNEFDIWTLLTDERFQLTGKDVVDLRYVIFSWLVSVLYLVSSPFSNPLDFSSVSRKFVA